MTIEMLTALLVVITAFYAGVTFKIMSVNKATLAAMLQQGEAFARPHVSVSVFSQPNNPVFYLKIASTGRTAANNVRLELDRDFYQYGDTQLPNLRETTAFQQPMDCLPPGGEMIFGLAPGHVVLGQGADPSLTPPVFSITATYSYGEKTVSEVTTIDLRPYRESMAPPSAVADELKKIRQALETIASQA